MDNKINHRINKIKQLIEPLEGFSELQKKGIDRVNKTILKIELLIDNTPDLESDTTTRQTIKSYLRQIGELTTNLVEIDQLTNRLNTFKENKNTVNDPMLLLVEEALESLQAIVYNYEIQISDLKINQGIFNVPRNKYIQLVDERNEFVGDLNKNTNRKIKSGLATRNKWQQKPRELLRQIISNYASAHPHLLNKTTLVRDVKADLRKLLQEQLKSNGLEIKGNQSLDKDIMAVLEELEYPPKVTKK